MPYRFHPTKRGLYKLAAEKAAELSWLELPKSSETVSYTHLTLPTKA